MTMVEGWFSAYRDGGNPTYHSSTLYQPLNVNIRTVIVFLLFVVPYIAFIIILPGMREKRFSSFFTITHHLIVGTLLMVALALPYWNVGSNVIVSQFRAYSDLRHEARLGVSVGLTGFNVSLNYIKTLNSEDPYMYRGMYFNERYTMDGVTEMQEELQGAYDQGLPYPFLKVLEYFSVNAGSFCWGREYRKAGYYTDALLWFSFSLWLLQCILLFLLPHQYSKVGLLTGCFILLGVLIYVILGPNQLHIPFIGSDGQKILISMRYGCCFYLAIAAGIMSIIHSFTLCVLQYFRLYALDTILSSKLDEDVSPKCRWGNKTKKQCNDNASACSDVSTYISEEGRSTPQYKDDVKITTTAKEGEKEFHQKYDNLECQIADEEIPLPTTSHKKQKSSHSHDSGASNETRSTVAEISSIEFDAASEKSIEVQQQQQPPHQRKDSIGSVDPKEFEETNSPAFSRRNFTLPLSH